MRQIDYDIANHKASLDSFQDLMQGYFKLITPDNVYARRPRLAVSILVPGNPEAILSVRPGWLTSCKKLLTDMVVVELLVNHDGEQDLWKMSGPRPCDVELVLMGSLGNRIASYKPSRWQVSLGRIVSAIELFLNDPKESLLIPGGRCAMCGRVLTDGASLLRGFGPECTKHVAHIIRLFEEAKAVVPIGG